MCGSLFGGSSTPTVQKVTPAPTPTEQANVASTSAITNEVDNAKRKRGYAATRTSTDRTDTIAGFAGKTTLG